MKIHARKDRLKFSSAHMTVFPDGTKESLHGHNYQVSLEVEFQEHPAKEIVLFSELKNAVENLCHNWDEKVLLAEKSPHFEIKSQKKNALHFMLCKKEYLLPGDEAVLLPVDNITCENLTALFLKEFVSLLSAKTKKNLTEIVLCIEESPGQGASEVWKNVKKK